MLHSSIINWEVNRGSWHFKEFRFTFFLCISGRNCTVYLEAAVRVKPCQSLSYWSLYCMWVSPSRMWALPYFVKLNRMLCSYPTHNSPNLEIFQVQCQSPSIWMGTVRGWKVGFLSSGKVRWEVLKLHWAPHDWWSNDIWGTKSCCFGVKFSNFQ